MTFYMFITFVAAVFTLSAAKELTLPVTTCKRDSNDYASCLKLAVEEAWPRFVPGLPEFNFPSLDPLFYENQKNVFKSGEINAEITFRDVIAKGMANVRFFAVKTQFLDNTFRLIIDAMAPSLNLAGKCNATGIIGGFKMGGDGYFNLTMEEVKGSWDLIGPVINDTWIVEHFHTTPTIKSFKISMEGLFDGNKELNDLTTTFVNEYWPMLYRILLPRVSKIWDKWLTNRTNVLFSKVSFSKTFL